MWHIYALRDGINNPNIAFDGVYSFAVIVCIALPIAQHKINNKTRDLMDNLLKKYVNGKTFDVLCEQYQIDNKDDPKKRWGMKMSVEIDLGEY